MDILTLNPVEQVIAESLVDSVEFKEFCNDLDALDKLLDDEYYIEAVHNMKSGPKALVKGTIKNTIDTTRDVGVAYHNITDANAGLIKNTWDLCMNFVKLATRAIGFIIKHLADIPLFILKVMNKIYEIPSYIRNKIKGNIQLHISAKDIGELYNKSLFMHVSNIIQLGSEMTKGDIWGRRSLLDNDKKHAIALEKHYNKIADLKFKAEFIDLGYKPNVLTYFGRDKVVKFNDAHGKRFELTYYEGLKKLLDDIKPLKKELKDIYENLGDKFKASETNHSFAQLSAGMQRHVMNTIQYVSKSVQILGHIMTCITKDMKTVNKSVDDVIKKSRSFKAKKKDDEDDDNDDNS